MAVKPLAYNKEQYSSQIKEHKHKKKNRISYIVFWLSQTHSHKIKKHFNLFLKKTNVSTTGTA
jgi:hypothetical protein